MRLLQSGGRARLGLATVLALAVGLVGVTGASAAPGDNLRNAGTCLRGGWHTLKTSNGRSFNGPIGCVIYALRGGVFGVAAPPPSGGSE
jgi:hypothetical protein